MILEHFADNAEESELANRGFMLWGNLNHEYTEGAMGYSSNFNRFVLIWGWNSNKVVAYGESHDEERILYKCLQFGAANGPYNIKPFPSR